MCPAPIGRRTGDYTRLVAIRESRVRNVAMIAQ